MAPDLALLLVLTWCPRSVFGLRIEATAAVFDRVLGSATRPSAGCVMLRGASWGGMMESQAEALGAARGPYRPASSPLLRGRASDSRLRLKGGTD